MTDAFTKKLREIRALTARNLHTEALMEFIRDIPNTEVQLGALEKIRFEQVDRGYLSDAANTARRGIYDQAMILAARHYSTVDYGHLRACL